MNKNKSKSKKVFIITALLLFSSFLFIFLPKDNSSSQLPAGLNKQAIYSSDDSDNNSYLIVYFKNSTYNPGVKNKFEFYGGIVHKNWNDTFESFSGFSGIIPISNKSLFQEYIENEVPNATLENDEIIEAQLNFASFQTGAVNSTWFNNGYKGDTNSSIAVLDSGIDLSHIFLQDKVIDNKSFVDGESPLDIYGHGTFIGSVIAGTGKDPYNSTLPNQIYIKQNYTHSEIFGFSIEPKNYSIKIATFNISEPNEYISVNSSWKLITEGIDEFWVQIYYNGELVNSSFNENQSQYYLIKHKISKDELGLYDVIIKYSKESYKNPHFSISSYIEFFPEFYVQNYNYFTGIANGSKLVNYKVLNNSGKGRVSNLISALEFVYKNKNSSKIISVCLSVGTLGNDISAINRVIDEISDEGILVIIAVGNYGIQNFETLNTLGKNRNSIVVGAINDDDQVTSYSSMGKIIDGGMIKPDIVAPGGSKIVQHRNIISAAANTNITSSSYGTSISTAIIAAAINILIEAKWNNWIQWNSLNTTKWSKIMKSILLMTATETYLEREDDPNTEVDESQYSPSLYQAQINSTHRAGLKDEHEGYGRVNIQAAIDALTKTISPNITYEGHLVSSRNNPLGTHAFARKVNLIADHQYLFNLTDINLFSTFDLYLYSNETNRFGEPILLASSRKSYNSFDYLYFTPRKNETNPILVIKAINGESNFTFNLTEVENIFDPKLKIPEVSYINGPKNTTVLSLSEIQGDKPEYNITLDRYKFYVEYFDNDTANVPPQQVYVYIQELAKNFTLTQLNPEDNNYTNGAIFSSQYIELPENKTYHYRFYVKDGLRNAILPIDIFNFFEIDIYFPPVIKHLEYHHHFNIGLDNWTITGTGWDLLIQNNLNDNRSRVYENDWKSIYFGSYHNYPKNYTYQPIGTETYLNGSFTSPYFNLTGLGEDFVPIAKIGSRVSINDLDSINLYINVNGTGWKSTPLRNFSNLEDDWFLEEINLTDYKGNYVKFRFNASLDEKPDFIYYKGFMLDYFAIENASNISPPEINFNLSKNIHFSQDLKYQKVKFSLEYFDQDNNYPEYVYLEINNDNYSMINYFGDWNASSNKPEDKGIYFVRSLNLNEILNQSFKFYVSDGNFTNSTIRYNTNNELITFNTPELLEYNVYQQEIPIGFLFSNSLENLYVIGTPIKTERTAWLRGDNTWHIIHKLYREYFYGGMGQGFSESFRGYGQNWDAQLITKPIRVLSKDKIFLEFKYEIDLEYEGSRPEDERDYCQVSISSDFGETWKILKNYYSDPEMILKGNESIDISSYRGETVMIKFSLHSNDYAGGSPGYGWLLSDIYIGYDRNKDHTSQNIFSLYGYFSTIYDEEQIKANQIIDPILIFYIICGIAFSIVSIFIIYKSALYLIGIRNKIISRERIKQDSILRTLMTKKKSSDIIAEIKYLEKTQAENPLILYCKYCKSWFYTNKKYDIICPICEKDQIYAAYNCINCDKWYFKDKPDTNYYCDECNIKLLKQDKEIIENLIHEKGKILQEYTKKKDQFSILD